MTDNLVQAALRQIVAGFDTLGHRGSVALQRTILEAGNPYIGSWQGHRYTARPERRCYQNAARLMKTSRLGLRYCEGYAVRPDLAIPIHHAWCLDRDNRVIDVTWRNAAEAHYLGVAFTRPEYARTAPTGSWSLFDTGRGLNLELIRRLCPNALTE